MKELILTARARWNSRRASFAVDVLEPFETRIWVPDLEAVKRLINRLEVPCDYYSTSDDQRKVFFFIEAEEEAEAEDEEK